jgi:hypothetical protein
MIIELPIALLSLQLSRALSPSEATLMRGFAGKLMPNSLLIHHHYGDRLVYTYPRVQFKIIGGRAVVLGIAEGTSIVADLEYLLQDRLVMLANEQLQINDIIIQQYIEPFGLSDGESEYIFISPWLALNDHNYRRYVATQSGKKQNLLRQILIGNILSMAKGLGIVVPERIFVELEVNKRQVSLKGNKMFAFLGKFRTNFLLPDLAGLGKSVSRGFGTIQSTSSKVTESYNAACH